MASYVFCFQVEEDLKKMIKAWEEENEGFFFVHGQNYLEMIKTQQKDRKTKKDLLKLGKVTCRASTNHLHIAVLMHRGMGLEKRDHIYY